MKVYVYIRRYMDHLNFWQVNQLICMDSPIPGSVEFDINDNEELFYDGKKIVVVKKGP